MAISNELINEIRRNANIVDVISHYIQVSKNGKSFKAVCPFHNDHDPSLSISEDKQIFKCFVCNTSGNVFSFVSKYENIGFVESVKKVAEITNQHVDIEYEKPKIDPKKKVLYDSYNDAIKFLTYNLNLSSNIFYKTYLTNRGLDNNVISTFEIGYNGKNNELYNFLKAKGHSDRALVDSNLAYINEYGASDVYSDRITFPIHDINGNPIGISARSLNENTSKYINTMETIIYKKGETIYNYHRAKPFIKKENKVIVVEGVLDVIAFYRADVFNVVSSLGTALTKEQVNILSKNAKTIVFSYDGDDAGQNATFKACKLALSMHKDVRIIKNSTKYDPDELIDKFGKNYLNKLSNSEITWLEFCFDYYLNKYNLDNYSEKKEFALKIMEEINEVDDELDKKNFTLKLNSITGFDMDYKVKKPINFIQKIQNNNKDLNGRMIAERKIIYNLFNHKEAIQVFKEDLGFLIDDSLEEIAMLILDYARSNEELEIADFINYVENEEYKKILFDILTGEKYKEDYDKKRFISYINVLKKWILIDKNEKLKKEIELETDNKRKEELMLQYSNNLIEVRRYNIEN